MRGKKFVTYFRSQFTALIATAFDFGITIFLKEVISLWYLHAVAIGAAVGAFTAFFLNRNWVFKSKNGSVSFQLVKYGIVVLGSWFLNTIGVFAMTEILSISYLYSKLVVSIIIGLSYNYILAKRFVFV